MAVRRNKKGEGGAPRWMTTFADLMAVLVVFFVMLYAFSTIDADRLLDVSVGFFRTNPGYLKNMRRQRPDSALLHQPWETDSSGCASYPREVTEEARSLLRKWLQNYVPTERIYLF